MSLFCNHCFGHVGRSNGLPQIDLAGYHISPIRWGISSLFAVFLSLGGSGWLFTGRACCRGRAVLSSCWFFWRIEAFAGVIDGLTGREAPERSSRTHSYRGRAPAAAVGPAIDS
jgi:hypothetical protein